MNSWGVSVKYKLVYHNQNITNRWRVLRRVEDEKYVTFPDRVLRIKYVVAFLPQQHEA